MIHHKARGGPYHDSPPHAPLAAGRPPARHPAQCHPSHSGPRPAASASNPPGALGPPRPLCTPSSSSTTVPSATYVGTSQARHSEFHFTVECEQAALATSGLRTNDSLLLKRGAEVESIPTDPPPGGMSPEETDLRHVRPPDQSGRRHSTLSGRNNLAVIRVIDAIARSTDSGEAIELA